MFRVNGLYYPRNQPPATVSSVNNPLKKAPPPRPEWPLRLGLYCVVTVELRRAFALDA